MSEEEKKAVKELKGCVDFWKEQLEKPYISEEDIEIAHKEIKHDTILLNLIEKQQAQLQEKDKLIKAIVADIEEHMSEEVCNYLYICDECKSNNEDCHGDYCKEAIIEYFTKKAREV